MTLATATKFNTEHKLFRTLEQCKQIPKDDRLFLRKIVIQGNCQLIKILQDNQNKKIQIKLRKFTQRQKQNKKAIQIQQIETYEKQRPKSRDERYNKMQKMLKNMKQFKNSIQKKTKTQANSLYNSRRLQGRNKNILFTQNQNLRTQNYFKKQQTQTNQIFTPLSFLEQIKHFYKDSGKKIILENSIEKWHNNEIMEKFSPYTSTSLSKQQVLKNTLLSHFGEDIFLYICQKHFPLSFSTESVYLPYRKLLQQIQAYSQSISSSSLPNSIESSILSSSNFSKLSSPISTPGQFSKSNSATFINEKQFQVPIIAPFQSEAESVTIQKLAQFLERYCLKKNNQIYNMFIIMGSSQHQRYNSYTINLDRFIHISQWRGNQLNQAFKTLIKKWGSNNSITYWRMLRVKEQKEVKQFFEKYRRV